jgi:hypothetical protein
VDGNDCRRVFYISVSYREKGIDMKTFTYGQTPNAVIREALPHKYPMELNRSDMMMILKVLNWASQVLRGKPANWAMGMRSSILETIGIEEV